MGQLINKLELSSRKPEELFTHAPCDTGDTPQRDVRRNSIDLGEVEDTSRSSQVVEERAMNKGKRMSFSDEADEELDKSSRQFGVRSSLLTSAISDASTDNATPIHDMHEHLYANGVAFCTAPE